MPHMARKRNQTQKDTNTVPVHLEKTQNRHAHRIKKKKKIRRGLGARDRVLLLIGNMSSGLGQTAF